MRLLVVKVRSALLSNHVQTAFRLPSGRGAGFRSLPRGSQLRELAQEVEGAPEEVGAAGAAAGMDSAQARRQLRQLEARAAAEEDLMMRVPLSKVRPVVGTCSTHDCATRQLMSSSASPAHVVIARQGRVRGQSR